GEFVGGRRGSPVRRWSPPSTPTRDFARSATSAASFARWRAGGGGSIGRTIRPPARMAARSIRSTPFRGRTEGRRSERRRRALASRVDRTHQPHGIAIGIRDDGVARAPERVARGLLARVARTREIGIDGVHRLPRREVEPDDVAGRAGLTAPAGVPAPRELDAVALEEEA